MPMEIDYSELAEEQQKDKNLQAFLLSGFTKTTSCKFDTLAWGESQVPIVFETSTGKLRPFIPESLQRRAFNQIHRLSHPNGKTTAKMMQQRYFWPGMNKSVKNWAKHCIDCQQSKISRHVKNKPGSFKAPESRFDQIHIDIIGPMPTSNGYNYCLTLIDRFSRWPEAFPITDTTAETVSKALYEGWICRYGTPLVLTTDQGSQFESLLFNALLKFAGCERIRTTAYHPAANGLVERLHRTMKGALMCIGNKSNWTDLLPTVMLGLRTCIREDVGASPAEYVFGKTLRLPGEFFSFGDFTPDPQFFIENYRKYMKELQSIPAAHHYQVKPFVFKTLGESTHVFLRRETEGSLERPYEGPYKVLQRRSDLVYEIERNGEKVNVTTERLKPAFIEKVLEWTIPSKNTTGNSPINISNQSSPADTPTTSQRQNTSATTTNDVISTQQSTLQPKTTQRDSQSKATISNEHSYAQVAKQPKVAQTTEIATKKPKFVPSILKRKPTILPSQSTSIMVEDSQRETVLPLPIPVPQLRTYPARKRVTFNKKTQINYISTHTNYIDFKK